VDALHLELEDRGVGVDLAPDAVGLYILGKIWDALLQHGRLPGLI
jgi:hypothetical protein